MRWYVEGLNLAIEWRDADGETERFGDLAAELVRLKVDVIVAANPERTLAAKHFQFQRGPTFGHILLDTPETQSPSWRACRRGR
jgi:hypothetical protein